MTNEEQIRTLLTESTTLLHNLEEKLDEIYQLVPLAKSVLPSCGISTGYKIINRTSAARTFELDQCAEVKAGYIRLDCTEGNQSLLDSLVPMVLSRGLKVMLILHGSSGAILPETAYAFANKMVTKWKDRVKLWEFCNEPDWNKNWTPATYTAASIEAYKAAKAVDPSCYFVTGALWKWKDVTGQKTHDWVRGMYSAGIAGKFDAISFHGYDHPNVRASWNIWDSIFHVSGNVRAVMVANGDSQKHLISTEGGGKFIGEGGSYSEAQLAEIVKQNFDALTTYKDANLKSIMIYSMMNDDVPGYGMLRSDFTKRPSWEMFKSRASLLV